MNVLCGQPGLKMFGKMLDDGRGMEKEKKSPDRVDRGSVYIHSSSVPGSIEGVSQYGITEIGSGNAVDTGVDQHGRFHGD